MVDPISGKWVLTIGQTNDTVLVAGNFIGKTRPDACYLGGED